MYADDTTGYFVHENVECVIEGLNKMLQIIHQWCIANKLTINTDKTEAMLITKRPFIGRLLRLTLGEKVIDLKEYVKCLGVISNKGLHWDKQIKNSVQNYNGKLCQLKRMRFLGRKVLEEIYFKSVIAGVTYCMAVWGTVSKSKFDQLEAEHRRAARFIYDLSSTDDALEKAR